MSVIVTQLWVSYEFIWHTAMDDRVCPFCDRLEGQTWMGDKLTGILEHPQFGPVWDLDADVSLAHPWRHGLLTCRCFLEVRPIVEWEKSEVFKNLQSTLTEYGYMPSNIDEAKREIQELDRNLQETKLSVNDVNLLLIRYSNLARRLGLPEEYGRLISELARLRAIIMITYRSLTLLSLGLGPVGLLRGMGGLGVAMMMAGDFLLDSTKG